MLTWYLTLLRVVRILGVGFPSLSRIFPFNGKVVSNWIVDINININISRVRCWYHTVLAAGTYGLQHTAPATCASKIRQGAPSSPSSSHLKRISSMLVSTSSTPSTPSTSRQGQQQCVVHDCKAPPATQESRRARGRRHLPARPPRTRAVRDITESLRGPAGRSSGASGG